MIGALIVELRIRPMPPFSWSRNEEITVEILFMSVACKNGLRNLFEEK